jgi:hypothetical protein
MMEKRNVVEQERTPEHEYSRPDEDWDKHAADLMGVSGGVTIENDSKPEDD